MEKSDSYGKEIEGDRREWYQRAFSGDGAIRKVPFVIDRSKGIFVSKKRLKEYGWSRSLILRFLGQPDRQTRNRQNRRRKTALYLIDRVEKVQMSSEFMKGFQAANKRRIATAKANETKKQRVDANPAQVQLVDREVLIKKASEYFVEWMEDDGFEEPIYPEEFRPDFVRYVVGLYIREHLVTFQVAPGRANRKKLNWKEADEQTRKIVVHEIVRVYPWLSYECKRLLKSDHPDMICEDVCGDFYVM